MTATARISAEKTRHAEERSLDKGKVLRKLTRQHPAGLSAYSLWVEVFEKAGDASRVVSLLDELAEEGLVSRDGGCWYAGATAPPPPVRSEPATIVASRPAVALDDTAARAPEPLPPRSPLPLARPAPTQDDEAADFRARLAAALEGRTKGDLARAAIECGGYPASALSTIAALFSAIVNGRTRGTTSIYREGIEAALLAAGHGRTDGRTAPGFPELPSGAPQGVSGLALGEVGLGVTQAPEAGGGGEQPSPGEGGGVESLVGDSSSPPDATGSRQPEAVGAPPAPAPHPHRPPPPAPVLDALPSPPAEETTDRGESPEGRGSVDDLPPPPLLDALRDAAETLERARLALAAAAADDILERALDDIAALCGCPTWEYAGQVVRDVRALLEQRDAARAELAALRARLLVLGGGGS